MKNILHILIAIAMLPAILFSLEKADFIKYLESDNPATRKMGAVSLKGNKDTDAVEKQKLALSNETNPEVKKVLVMNLLELKENSSIASYLDELGAEKKSIRAEIYKAISPLPEKIFLKALVEGLNDPELEIQMEVLKALSIKKDKIIAPYIAYYFESLYLKDKKSTEKKANDRQYDREVSKLKLLSIEIIKNLGNKKLAENLKGLSEKEFDENVKKKLLEMLEAIKTK